MSEVAGNNNGLQNSPTVLVVDDEELMREVVTIMIEENGGQAITASDGQEAVEVVQARGSEIDIVVMDFSMPRLNGFEAFVKMRELKPTLPVILASGLVMTKEVMELKAKGEIDFLGKPFPELELVKAINRRLST